MIFLAWKTMCTLQTKHALMAEQGDFPEVEVIHFDFCFYERKMMFLFKKKSTPTHPKEDIPLTTDDQMLTSQKGAFCFFLEKTEVELF